MLAVLWITIFTCSAVQIVLGCLKVAKKGSDKEGYKLARKSLQNAEKEPRRNPNRSDASSDDIASASDGLTHYPKEVTSRSLSDSPDRTPTSVSTCDTAEDIGNVQLIHGNMAPVPDYPPISNFSVKTAESSPSLDCTEEDDTLAGVSSLQTDNLTSLATRSDWDLLRSTRRQQSPRKERSECTL